VKVSNLTASNGTASPVVTFINTVMPLNLVVVASANSNGRESAPSATQTLQSHTWTFSYSEVYPGASVPTQQLLSDSSTIQSSGWASIFTVNPYIQADFGSVKTVTSIIVGPITDGGWQWSNLNTAALQYSSDGSNWSDVTSSINQTNTSLTTITYSNSISARYVRIMYLDNNARYLGVSTFHFTFA
jgi:hypothetical protein